MSTNTSAQKHLPDSIAQKVEDFTQFLLYRNHDTTYISSYIDKLAVRLIANHKYNAFGLADRSTDSYVKYRPDKNLNLGFGVAYKWFALNLVFNFGIGEDTDFKNKQAFDVNATVFGGKHFISGTYQYYFGYQMSKLNGVPSDVVPQDYLRDDIRTTFVELQYLFAYNYDRFSLKASFIQNEIQRKSAGSILFGAQFQVYTMDADSAIVPSVAKKYFSENADVTGALSSSVVVSAGYMYTYVFKKHFYITLSAIPGVGITLADFKTIYKQPVENRITMNVISMNAIGYTTDRFFCGATMHLELNRLVLSRDLHIKQTSGNFRFHTGWRF